MISARATSMSYLMIVVTIKVNQTIFKQSEIPSLPLLSRCTACLLKKNTLFAQTLQKDRKTDMI